MPTAFITGAARGIGAAAARNLSRSGWKVALIDAAGTVIDAPGGSPLSTASELRDSVAACDGPESIGIAADVRSRDQTFDAVARAKRVLGSPDAAIAAAGRISSGLAWETESDIWQEMLEVNLYGTRYLAEATIPEFIEAAGRRSFVAVSSAAALTGLEQIAAYSAAKSAVVGFVRALAADLRGTGITANAICPGSTDTAMLEASAAIYGLDSTEEFATHQLVGRLLRPTEVAAAIAFLCGPDGGGITGTAIPVDGGMTA
jgi:SDR family mycofactocin-dependent oxidoreductase